MPVHSSSPPSSSPVWLRPLEAGVVLRVHTQPRASRTEVVGVHGDRLKIRVAGVPVDGRANADLCRFLAECLSVSPSSVRILRGETSRDKDILVAGVSARVAAALAAAGS